MTIWLALITTAAAGGYITSRVITLYSFRRHSGKGTRKYEFLQIYVDKDCSDSGTRIIEADKDKLMLHDPRLRLPGNPFPLYLKKKFKKIGFCRNLKLFPEPVPADLYAPHWNTHQLRNFFTGQVHDQVGR